jgi:hypothetical protein
MKSIYKLLVVSAMFWQIGGEASANCAQNERICYRHCWERHLGHVERRIHCDRMCDARYGACVNALPPPVIVEPMYPYAGPYYWGRHRHHRAW